MIFLYDFWTKCFNYSQVHPIDWFYSLHAVIKLSVIMAYRSGTLKLLKATAETIVIRSYIIICKLQLKDYNNDNSHCAGLWNEILSWLIFLGIAVMGDKLLPVTFILKQQWQKFCRWYWLNTRHWDKRDVMRKCNLHYCGIGIVRWFTNVVTPYSFSMMSHAGHIKLRLDLITKNYDELEGTKFWMGT